METAMGMTGKQGNDRRGRHRQAGFTLIEMVVVLAVISMVALLVFERGPWRSLGLDRDAAVRALVGAMRLARSEAMANNRDVVLQTGLSGFAVDGAGPRLVASGVTMSASRIVFTPDGTAHGAAVRIVAGDRLVVVGVEPLTGRAVTAP